jgi:hypothetical protein
MASRASSCRLNDGTKASTPRAAETKILENLSPADQSAQTSPRGRRSKEPWTFRVERTRKAPKCHKPCER